MVPITHEQNIICSKTRLDGTTHEQTIICWQLFAGHVVDSQPLERKKKAHRMIMLLIWKRFKVNKNGVFLLGIYFFVLEIFTFLYYANEESDDVIGGSTQSRISLEIFEKCSLNLAPEMFITKETKWHLSYRCHNNSYATGPVLIRTKTPRFN